MNELTKDDRSATIRHFILGHLIDVCGLIMTPDLVGITSNKISHDVLHVIDRDDFNE